MHIKKYTVASLILIAIFGWIGTFTDETVSINVLGVVLPSLSIAVLVMIPMFVLFLASVVHISFYSMLGSFKLRKYEKDYEKIIDAIADAYLGKENRNHVFKTPRYKNLGYMVDNTSLFANSIDSSTIEEEKIASVLKLIEDVKNGEVVELKKLNLSNTNSLVLANNLNSYNKGILSAEDILSHSDNYDEALLEKVYLDFVKTSPLYAIEKYKEFMTKESLNAVMSRVNADENTLEISTESLISLFKTMTFTKDEYLKISSTVSLTMIPEQRIQLFELLSDDSEDAMDAYLFTLFDLEMLAPADAILDISQPDEYLNFKAYRTLKECNKNFNINLFV